MKIRKEYTCPLEIMHDIINGKWKMVILWQLKLRGRTSLNINELSIKRCHCERSVAIPIFFKAKI